jgi:protein-S-isoprenylcysteine O-methyltransferase Ste14
MATNDDTSGVRVFPPGIYLIAVLVGFLLQKVVPLRAPTSWQPVEYWTGVVLIVAGLGITLSAVGVFRMAGTSPNPTKPVTAFVVRGPYRFTRNPMYLGFTLLSAGIGLMTNSLWVAAMAVVAAAVTKRLVIDKEEPYLARRFGSDYLTYQQRVRRWV